VALGVQCSYISETRRKSRLDLDLGRNVGKEGRGIKGFLPLKEGEGRQRRGEGRKRGEGRGMATSMGILIQDLNCCCSLLINRSIFI